jgi:hypothetical protein
MAIELIDQGVTHLAVQVGHNARGKALTRILSAKGSPGWNLDAGAVHEWRFQSVVERDGEVFLCGPLVKGTSLEEVLSLPLARALPFVSRLVNALRRLPAGGGAWFPIESDAVLFTDAGGVLFLPPAVCAEIRDMRTFELNRESYESLNHPDLRDEERASFTIAAILYRVITGRFPFTGADAEELHEQTRKLSITAPSRAVPELAPEVSDLVMAGLGRAQRGPVDLSEWATSMEAWKSVALFIPLSAERKDRALSEMRSQETGSARSFKRRMFWEKNWKLIAVIVAIVIAVSAVFGSVLKNALAPRVTRGYAAEKVVTTFYTSMNALDHMTMQACVVGKAGKGDINATTTLYVTSKVTQGYGGRSNIVSAADWDGRGRPALVSPQALYGVTSLVVTEEQGEPSPVFNVTYDKWTPASPPETEAGSQKDEMPRSEGNSVAERVWMKRDNGDWVIYRIERLSQTPLPAPLTTVAPAADSSPGMGRTP